MKSLRKGLFRIETFLANDNARYKNYKDFLHFEYAKAIVGAGLKKSERSTRSVVSRKVLH